MDSIFTKLSEPFQSIDLEWRAGALNADKTKALALAYITSRAVMDRLDQVVGPSNWRDEYKPGSDGGLICGISIRIDGEWITKWDGAENTQFEEVKGGLSGAFKRAAVKWGIGRYLYKLTNTWMPCEIEGKSVILKAVPPLPAWALPISASGNPVPSVMETKDEASEIQAIPISDGNGNSPASRSISWGKDIVDAVMQSGAAENVVQAVQLLNASDLPRDTTSMKAKEWVLAKQSL